ncbi:unnamed protein product (macronuclear) [Paramecium tetraurelia]|uniref:Uncharacterized protein n=1 Tax=Paramecium tetraurelia TaxID=5888 RepID=A0DHS5_PARTE|nr:uncharacterized protein GSPATT00016979001 [Paramecium tetraurelia]CAK82592.1 unnamed protein product [Paramecium tetraurelia]|eukprot:XP_001449989.1 hypothetical protein (macronuclear) [Paramecium tetraurelia strain d4-2]
MKGFMNPIFHHVDDEIEVEERRTFQIPLQNFSSNIELPKEYERIFSSITDSSQQLNDSILQPFDNSKYEQTLLIQNNNSLSTNHPVSQKNQRPIVKFDKNSLQQILQILASYHQCKQKPQKEQIINQINNSKKIKISPETKHFQFNKMKNIIKNDSTPKNQPPSKQNENDIKSHKHRSSTNYTPRAETSAITVCHYSSKNLDANLNQKQDSTNIIQLLQKRTKSQYYPKQLIKTQIDDINGKIIQLKNIILKSIKYDPMLEPIQVSIDKIIKQNEDSNLLQKEVVHLKDITNSKSFKESKYNIQFNVQKLISVVKEKQKKIELIMIFNKDGSSNDSLQSPKANCILSRQTTSDNITEEIQDDKKRFFQLVVNRKLELPFNHPNKDVMLNELYDKAIKMGIKKSDWQQFIVNELKF